MAVFSKQWTLLESAEYATGSPNGAAKDVSMGYNQAWEAAYTAEKARLLIHLSVAGAAGTIIGTLQGLRPGGASTSTTVADWYPVLTTDLVSTVQTYQIILGS